MNHNHDISNAAAIPVAGEMENTEISHEPADTSTVTELGSVAVDVAAGSRSHPKIEQMNKVEAAYFQGSSEDLLRLIDDGEIDIDDVDFEGRTPIMMMTAKGEAAAVEGLIERGADLNRIIMYQGRLPMSALDAARQMRQEALEQLLLDNGAKFGRDIHADNLAAEQDE